VNNDTNQTEVIEHKISSQSIRDVAAYFDLSLKALANVIECNPAQIYNNPNRLSSASAQHILQLSHLMCITTTYFGSVRRAVLYKYLYNKYNLIRMYFVNNR
jgi:hypothetical protein